jgi:hypothetical protein
VDGLVAGQGLEGVELRAGRVDGAGHSTIVTQPPNAVILAGAPG